MAKEKKSIKGPEQAETPISSMIDIVFLLIIFFVVTASVDKEVEDEKVILATAPHGKPVVKKDPRSIVINVHQDGVMTMGMGKVTKDEIAQQLKKAMAGVPDAVNNMPIIIRGDFHAQHKYIRDVMDAVKSTGLYKIRFNAQRVDE